MEMTNPQRVDVADPDPCSVRGQRPATAAARPRGARPDVGLSVGGEREPSFAPRLSGMRRPAASEAEHLDRAAAPLDAGDLDVDWCRGGPEITGGVVEPPVRAVVGERFIEFAGRRFVRALRDDRADQSGRRDEELVECHRCSEADRRFGRRHVGGDRASVPACPSSASGEHCARGPHAEQRQRGDRSDGPLHRRSFRDVGLITIWRSYAALDFEDPLSTSKSKTSTIDGSAAPWRVIEGDSIAPGC